MAHERSKFIVINLLLEAVLHPDHALNTSIRVRKREEREKQLEKFEVICNYVTKSSGSHSY